ncbi:hypothetical protein Poly24_45690 [Rosistilla carotiformis]|uniref:ATP-grasp domain-containing protein n=1 Tax=Rosistilla carotiformis TaxID=2528017 RepID=A0A518JZ63_9BACT|nr:acetate--CoA ligase family protein [Rosistilla carotiformis]QDV70836.1 hypothetical protein Poly24_45690 [Rosistilla carotiformis]
MSIRCAERLPVAKQIALISESAVLCDSLVDRARQRSVGLSHVVSVGKLLGTTLVDYVLRVAADPETDAIGICVDSIDDVAALIEAAEECSGRKPIVIYTPKTFWASARDTFHEEVWLDRDRMDDAVFRKCGMVRVAAPEDVVDAAAFLSRKPRVSGARVAIITNASGIGRVAVEAMQDRRSVLAELEPCTIESLKRLLPEHSEIASPFDGTDCSASHRFADAVGCVMEDGNADVVLVLWSPSTSTDLGEAATLWIDRCRDSTKLVLAVVMGEAGATAVEPLLQAAGIASFRSPQQAIMALDYLLQPRGHREYSDQPARSYQLRSDCSPLIVQQTLSDAVRDSIETMAEDASKRVLSAYGIPVAESLRAGSVDEAVACAEVLRYPVVLKIVSQQIAHKTDVGGVALHLHDASEVRAAFCGLMRSARQHAPDAIVPGVTVQPMIDSRDAFELIVGGFRDPALGPMLMLATGGIAGEALHDTVFELPPWNTPIARGMIRSLKIWPLMQGVRNRAAIDVDSLVDVMLRTAQMLTDCPEIRQLTMNPLLVSPHGAVALDARIHVRRVA